MSDVAPVAAPACSACGSSTVEPGFLEDMGEASQGYVRWIPGPLQRGMFGGAKTLGKQRYAVQAWRCGSCRHLDLYSATNPG
jgi:hypothetical protein